MMLRTMADRPTTALIYIYVDLYYTGCVFEPERSCVHEQVPVDDSELKNYNAHIRGDGVFDLELKNNDNDVLRSKLKTTIRVKV